MRKLIIFLYFVFLFKLAFAQSLPTLPSFSDFSKIEPAAGTDVAQVPDMPALGDDDDLPTDLDLPTTDKKAENEPTPADDVQVPEAPADTSAELDIEAPELEVPALAPTDNAAKNAAVPELPNEFEAPELPATADTGSTTEVPQAEVKDLPKLPEQPATEEVKAPELPATPSVGLGDNEAPALETAKENTEKKNTAKTDGSVMDQIISEDSERTEFPATPDLNYEKNKKASQQETEETAPVQSTEDREKEVDSLLNQVFDKGKTPEQIAQEKAQQEADEAAANSDKNAKQDDSSPLMEKVVDVNEQPVQSIDELQTDDNEQFELTDLPASMKESGGANNSPFNDTKPRAVYTSSTYSEQQLSDMLVNASMKGNKNSVVELIHSGRNPNSQNVYGETPLMGAVYNGHNDIVEVLLSEGADANITDNKGNSSLLVASARNNLQAVQQLIRGGADIDQANNSSDTPLLVATLNNNMDVADTLVRQGANINKSNADGLTALHIAAYNGNPAMVKYLLSVGANPNVAARGGHKPQDLAKDAQSKQLIASYVDNQQKAAEAKRLAAELQQKNTITAQSKPSDKQYAMYPSAYVEEPQQKQVQLPQSNWWAAKAVPAEKATPKTQQVADMPVQPIEENVSQETYINVETPQQMLPASIAYKNLVEQRGGYSGQQPTQYQAPASIVSTPVAMNNDKKWTKLTVNQGNLNTAPVPTINVEQKQVSALPEQTIKVQPASEFTPTPPAANAPQFTMLAPAVTPAAPQQPLVRAQYDVNGNVVNNSMPAQPQYQAPAQPVAMIPVAPVAAPAQAPASMSYKVPAYTAPAVTTASPVRANYSAVAPQAAQPQQYILPQGPISNSININVPKYSDLEPAKQAVWDMKLAQWVKDGMTINARSEGEKVYWMKQQQVLQAVYQEQFSQKVESVKRKINGAAFNLAPQQKKLTGDVAKPKPKAKDYSQIFSAPSSAPVSHSTYTLPNCLVL